ncbi:MAG: RNA methyltransferase [Ruminococcus sp.]|nr:RNA methyltransferase [Ruminococcus sp.]
MLIVTSKDNVNIKNTIKLKKSAKYRRESSAFIAEGVRVCMDAFLSNATIDIFFSTENARDKYSEEFNKLSNAANKTIIVNPSVFSLISDTQTPQGFLCVIKILDKNCEFDTIKNNSKFLGLDNVQDPNNLGTILRTAEAFGINGVVLSEDCCDIYSPKVVRGSMGAVFRLPFLRTTSICDFIDSHNDLKTFAAVIDNAQKLTEVDFSGSCMAVIGNEGNGLKPETIAKCNQRITIPMNGKAESLNASVAASIIMWEMVK